MSVEEGKRALFRRAHNTFLLEGENPIVIGRIHPAIFWKSGAVLLLAAVFVQPALNLAIFLGGIGILMALYAYITQKYLLLMLTDKHVIIRSGLAFADVTQIRHSQVESANLFAGVLGQLLGYAAVEIRGTGQRVVVVPYIANAGEFRRALEEVLVAREEGKR